MIQTISPAQLDEQLKGTPQPLLIDVRTPAEYTRGSLPGAINIPLDELEKSCASLLPDTSARMVVFCLSGSRSGQAMRLLDQAGYHHVAHLAGGLLAWRNMERNA